MLRPIPIARRLYVKQKGNKLLEVGAFSSADPGARSDALKTVLAPKNDSTISMCIDYCDLNAQTQITSLLLPRIDQVLPFLQRPNT